MIRYGMMREQVLGEQLAAFEVMWHNHYALLTEESGRHKILPDEVP
ncbi:MAG: hypothetical protein MH208_09035 [Marinobacter sp.]|nr:hypothetical protein [Marinobacter sp.]